MDPLSVTASIIAIVEAVGSIGTIIKTVRSLGNASAEFLALLNELSLMQAVLEQVKSSLENMQNLPTNTATNNLNPVKVLKQELVQISIDLTETAGKLIAGIKGRDRKGLPRISKTQWYQEKNNVIRLREKAQDVLRRLSLAFTAVNSSHIATQTGLIIDIQDIFETKWTSLEQNFDNGIEDLRIRQNTIRDAQAIMQTNIEIIKQTAEDIHVIKNELGGLKQMLAGLNSDGLQEGERNWRQAHQRRSMRHGYDGMTDTTGNEQTYLDNDQGDSSNGLPTTSMMGSVTLETQATEALTRSASYPDVADISTSAVAVSGTIRQRCPPGCKCQCHRTSHMKTPKILRSVIGVLCVQYNSIPFFDRRPCDSPLCQSKSRRFIRVQYHFPRWMVARAVCALVSSHGLTDAGASMHLKVPRVVDNPNIKWAIHFNDIQWLKHQISMRILSRTDIDEYGDCLINMAIFHRRWDFVQFLLDAGFDHSIQASDGRSPIHLMRYLVASNEVSPSLLIYLQVYVPKLLDVDEEYEPRSTTIIHDAVLGTTKTTLRDALEINPCEKDTLDHMGFSPLFWAVVRRDQQAVNELLSFGASANSSFPTAGTPLHMACQSGSVTLASMLIDAGADVNSRDWEGRTPLHQGVYSPSVTTLLLKHKANPNARDNESNSPLNVRNTVALAEIDDICTSFAALVGAGADLESTNKVGNTPLHTAAIFSPTAALCLIELGANVDACNHARKSFLHFVATYWNFEHIESLRNAKIGPIDTDVVDTFGHTALMTMWFRVRRQDDHTLARRAGRLTLGLIWSFTALIEDMRKRSWEAGLFLESRERVTADFSHQRMIKWLDRQWERMQKDDSLCDQTWTTSDGWWFDEELDEELSEGSEYDEELDDEFEEDRETRTIPGAGFDHCDT